MYEFRAFSVVGGPYDFTVMLNKEVENGWEVVNAGMSGEQWFAVLKKPRVIHNAG